MSKTAIRFTFVLLAAAYVATHLIGHAHAQSSLGIGTAEPALPSFGMFSGVLNWVNLQQQSFYRALTGAMKSMRDGGGGFWLLVGLSFTYGIFHAAGPGHGKAVISSYMLANEVALRRGVLLSFISAFFQAASAVAMMTAVYFVLRGTSISMTDTTRFLEIASYALIVAFGGWLLWKKARRRLLPRFTGSPIRSLSSASSALGTANACNHSQSFGLRYRGASSLPDAFRAEEVCETCGNTHAVDPALLAGERFDWRAAWTAMGAVGIRPCSGALIVLTFAFLNGLWVAGIASVLAMAVGTGITVAVLATLAVSAKNVAVALAGSGRTGNTIHAVIEIGGALMILLIGLTLLAASLSV